MIRTSLLLVCLCLALSGCRASGQEEFIGPYPSWANAKERYGARGDGQADDTAALQAGLNELGEPGKPHVLYLPAGTYRITGTLRMIHRYNVAVIGEDPERTIIRYQGPAGGDMLYSNGTRYSRWSRITWDGAGRAKTGVNHGWDGKTGHAATVLEHSDEVFKDLEFGIRAGTTKPGNFQDAEASVVRVRFFRCAQACISIESWNALDWWIRDSEFDSSRAGVTNEFGAGNFNVYSSVFRGSTYADISIANTLFFSIRGNTSINSRKFFIGAEIGRNSANITLQGNRIITPLDSVAVLVRNLGPLMMFDNQFQSRAGATGPVVEHVSSYPGVETVSVGNTFNVNNPLAVRSPQARTVAFADRTDTGLSLAVPALPPTPPKVSRTVFEVPPGAAAPTIQGIIDRAAELQGKRPVVHFPPGTFQISRTLRVPANLDLQMVGDSRATVLEWTGPAGGTVLRLLGPSRATLADFAIRGGNKAIGIAIENADQPGGRVFAHQIYSASAARNHLLVEGLDTSLVLFRDYVHLDAAVASVKVRGGSSRGAGAGRSRVVIAGGLGGTTRPDAVIYDVSDGGRLLVQDAWYEGHAPTCVRLSQPGTFVLQGGVIAPYPQSKPGPSVEFDSFGGAAAIVNAIIQRKVRVTNETSQTRVLLLGLSGRDASYLDRASQGGNVALLNSSQYVAGSGWQAVPDVGKPDPGFLAQMLALGREDYTESPGEPLPAGVTDVRMYRLAVGQTPIGIHVKKLLLTSAADHQAGPLVPGGLFTVLGEDLAPDTASASATPWPGRLAAAEVDVDGTAAPLFFVSPTQIKLQAPFRLPEGFATLTLKLAGETAQSITVPVASAGPAFFLTPEGHALVSNADGSLNAPDRPAKPDDRLVAYFTGGGAVQDGPPEGRAARARPHPLREAASSWVAGERVRIDYIGLVPLFIGVYQIIFRLPRVQPGSQPLSLQIGEWTGESASIAVGGG